MELTHVDLDERVVLAEQEVRERLRQLRLTHAGRAGEDERARRALRVLQARTRTTDRLRDRLDGVLLADDPLVQLVLHAEQTGGLLLGELEHGDAGPVAQDLRDLLLVDLGNDVEIARTPLLLALGALADELLLLVAQRRGLLEVLLVDRRFLLATRVGDLVVEGAQVRRRGHPADAHARARLVDEVDRLVRQEAVVDVPVRQGGGGDQRAVRDGDAVVRLVPVAQTLEDLDGVLDARLAHLDGLEAALQRGVLLDVLAVLVEGGRADGLQLAAGQLRLEDRRGVDRALGGTRTDERVQLVDEQDDVAAGVDLLEDLPQALLEVTAVARAGHQGPEVQGVELLVLERLGHVAVDDRLREALDDGRLADAGLADQHRVVLRAPREHLHDALDLLGAADDRVQLALGRRGGQVPAELVQDQGGRRGARLATAARPGPGAGRLAAALLALVAGEQLDDLLADAVEIGAQLHEDLGGDALALADQAEQDVLGADVVVAELQRLAQRELQDLLGTGREGDVARRGLLPLPDDLLDLAAHSLQGDAQRFEGLGRHAFTLMDQAQEDVLGADVVVIEHPGFFLRQDDDAASAVGEPLEHGHFPHIPVTSGNGRGRTRR
ncbi:Protein of uncharacterised function (DUF3170) (plasmid) [Tsukamurella tyrosinosolvens]|nr:Protein of uncharacterised function (DUF3170) [Tsukamurella tyrosinosolvens]